MSSQGAAAGPSGSKKCFYCRQDTTDCEIIQVFIKKQSAFICQECQETEKFTVAKLIEMMMLSGIKEGVDLESIRKMPFLQNYRFPEVLADISYETLGYLKLGECMQCEEKIKQYVSYCAFEEHYKAKHADEIASGLFVICDLGCRRLLSASSITKHKAYFCKKFCPFEGCKKDYLLAGDHFKSVHEHVFCPLNECPAGFLQGDVESFCSHIVKTHLNRSPFHFIADQISWEGRRIGKVKKIDK